MEKRNYNGFTLLELLIVMAIVAVLSALAGPSLRTMVLNNRLANTANDLLADLALARSEAIRVGKRVTICTSANGTSCDTSGADWGSSRLVFIDETTSGATGAIDTGETLLRATTVIKSGSLSITAAGFTNSSGSGTNYYFQYRSNGALNSTTTGTFTICDERGSGYGRTIEVLITGRASLTSTTASC